MKEIFRTQRFVRGLYWAVKDKLAQKGSPVQVLYAGTGPFATLALPIMSQFSPEEVQFSFLEINQNSYNKLLDVISAFNFQQYVKRIELTDATSYILPDKEVDIVLSETLNKALITEPQVFIMLNLASQLDDQAIYLPEEITVNLCAKKRNERNFTKLEKLITFNQAEMKRIIGNSGDQQWVFDEIKAELGDNEIEDLYYATEIKVYKNNFLGYNDSSLNFLEKVKPDQKDSKTLFFKYTANERPGFVAYAESLAKV
ncbi:hypothetical protein G7074_01720 [Pedobacter sp. HDW13]|uniref:hypothetical protein n=1 Tax=unclassified Pedobacter TaxID=2628915 RepID=UPI000F59D3A0|nr:MULTISPECIES: hypothetical protein [unclassified Pedobacter]QIL38106.1 hypothetical protein G7074_01720 [Pedobacter sp. HDW13]